ncbi:ABC transporter ATP-binding protein [Mycolicibacterium sp. YH-1]|uniref:ABC transporter ATP-binding protein n=1 Tax=Mycolicibacterium sp. YH-1 TaxID=2908837 RepID=UPI001F4C45AC|nr:ABC transporter ATP-binding protein [Mycolicibacterium sp. YH-1]UNB52929.1 ABC transporter ATP-binding protein [Mycolicibacterium sp. YH-1]
MTDSVVEVNRLTIETEAGVTLVENVNLTLAKGEILGIVGESGSGKTTTALALLGFQTPGARLARGSITVDGHSLSAMSEKQIRRIRGRVVAYVPQDPGAALNPTMRVGQTLRSTLALHAKAHDNDAEVIELLDRVRLPTSLDFRQRYPHQLSGGQQQRLAIAVAISCRPRLVVFDEPTTGLDVLTQHHILREVGDLRKQLDVAMVYISHDLRVVSSLVDRIAVMYGGRVVETGTTADLVGSPRHPYTRALLAAVPDHTAKRAVRGVPGVAARIGEHGLGCVFAPRCSFQVPDCQREEPPLIPLNTTHEVRCTQHRMLEAPMNPPPLLPRAAISGRPLLDVRELVVEYPYAESTARAVDNVSFSIGRGERIAVIGESGSGKSTLTRCIAGLIAPTSGAIELDGAAVASSAAQRPRETLRRIQMVFQNPYEALNPRRTVAATIARSAQVTQQVSASAARQEADRLLELVRLSPSIGTRYPSELSGGERQRVGIAAALVARPDLLLCDEVTSALDVSVQASIIELLRTISDDEGLSLLFVSHDLGVVASIADRVIVVENGRIAESGEVSEFFRTQQSPYGRTLISAAPRLEDRPVLTSAAPGLSRSQHASPLTNEGPEAH